MAVVALAAHVLVSFSSGTNVNRMARSPSISLAHISQALLCFCTRPHEWLVSRHTQRFGCVLAMFVGVGMGCYVGSLNVWGGYCVFGRRYCLDKDL